MTTCDRFVDRLYDEDARRALAAGEAPPVDMRAHSDACAECRRLWQSSGEEARVLRASLIEALARPARQRVAHAMREALPPQSVALIEWRSAAMWAVSGAALAVCGLCLTAASFSLAWQGVIVFVAAATALSAEVTLQGLEASGT